MRSIIAHIFYDVGDLVYRIMERVFDTDSEEEPSFLFHWTYDLYSWFIIKSCDIQGDSEDGPWNKNAVDEYGYWKRLCYWALGEEKGKFFYWHYHSQFYEEREWKG